MSQRVSKGRATTIYNPKGNNLMGVEVQMTFVDANGQEARTAFWTDTAAHAQSAIQYFGPVTNCNVLRAGYVTPLDISGAWNHAATAANVESALTKAKIQFEGAAAGGNVQFANAGLSIPAPIGTLINGKTGSNTDPLLTPLIPLIFSAHGDAMTVITSVKYSRGR